MGRHGNYSGTSEAVTRAGTMPPTHFSLRRPERAEMCDEGIWINGLGILEASVEGIAACGSATSCVSHESQLPSHLHSRTHRRRLSGRRVVSLLPSRSARTYYSGELDPRTRRQGIRVRD